MTQLSQDNILIFAAEDEKKVKKGNGLKSILGLMLELEAFQQKVKSCIEDQDMGEIKAQIESFDEPIMQMWKTLTKISEAGIKSIREMENTQAAPAQAPSAGVSKGMGGSEVSKEVSKEAPKAPHSPIMDANTIHKLPQ